VNSLLIPLLPLQRTFVPVLLIVFLWAIWRGIFKKDLAVGLALYLGLVVIVDGFMNTGIYLPGLEKGSIRYSEICALILMFNRPASVAAPPRRLITWLFASYFLLMWVAALRSTPVMPGILEFRSIIIPQIIAFTLAKRGLGTSESYRRFFMSLTVLVVLVGLFDFWDMYFDRWILKSEVLDKPIYAHNRELNRFGSVFLNPNYLGAFVTLVFPALFVQTLNERRFGPRLWGGIGLLSLLFCLVETQSRGPLLAFGIVVALLIVGPCGGVSRSRRVGFLALGVLVFALFMPGFFTHASERFSQLDEETATEGRTRETTWRYTQRIVAAHPVAGIGFGEGGFMQAMTDFGFVEEFGLEPLDAPHNSYLQVAVYAGVPALLVFLIANLALIGKAFSVSLRGDAGHAATVFGLAVGLIGFLASIFPDIQLFTANVAPLYWVFFGLLLAQVSAAPAAQTATTATAFPFERTRATLLRPPAAYPTDGARL
jgi:hypothetical protein